MTKKRVIVLSLVLMASILLVPAAGMAEDVTLTGTVTPQTAGISISPTVLDLSGKAGETISKSFTITNIGAVPVGLSLGNFTASIGNTQLAKHPSEITGPEKAHISLITQPPWTLPGGESVGAVTFDGAQTVGVGQTAYYPVTLPVTVGGYSLAPGQSVSWGVQLVTHSGLSAPATVSGTITITATP